MASTQDITLYHMLKFLGQRVTHNEFDEGIAIGIVRPTLENEEYDDNERSGQKRSYKSERKPHTDEDKPPIEGWVVARYEPYPFCSGRGGPRLRIIRQEGYSGRKAKRSRHSLNAGRVMSSSLENIELLSMFRNMDEHDLFAYLSEMREKDGKTNPRPSSADGEPTAKKIKRHPSVQDEIRSEDASDSDGGESSPFKFKTMDPELDLDIENILETSRCGRGRLGLGQSKQI